MQEECFLLNHGTLVFPRGEGLGLFLPPSSSPYGLCVIVLSQLLSSCLWMLKETERNSFILKSQVCYICWAFLGKATYLGFGMVFLKPVSGENDFWLGVSWCSPCLPRGPSVSQSLSFLETNLREQSISGEKTVSYHSFSLETKGGEPESLTKLFLPQAFCLCSIFNLWPWLFSWWTHQGLLPFHLSPVPLWPELFASLTSATSSQLTELVSLDFFPP